MNFPYNHMKMTYFNNSKFVQENISTDINKFHFFQWQAVIERAERQAIYHYLNKSKITFIKHLLKVSTLSFHFSIISYLKAFFISNNEQIEGSSID